MTENQILSVKTPKGHSDLDARHVWIRAVDGMVRVGTGEGLHIPDPVLRQCAAQLPLVRQVGKFEA